MGSAKSFKIFLIFTIVFAAQDRHVVYIIRGAIHSWENLAHPCWKSYCFMKIPWKSFCFNGNLAPLYLCTISNGSVFYQWPCSQQWFGFTKKRPLEGNYAPFIGKCPVLRSVRWMEVCLTMESNIGMKLLVHCSEVSVVKRCPWMDAPLTSLLKNFCQSYLMLEFTQERE